MNREGSLMSPVPLSNDNVPPGAVDGPHDSEGFSMLTFYNTKPEGLMEIPNSSAPSFYDSSVA